MTMPQVLQRRGYANCQNISYEAIPMHSDSNCFFTVTMPLLFGVRQPPQNPRLCPPLLISYPPLFRSKCVLCFPQEVIIPSAPKLEIFGKLQGTRRIFLFFASIDRESKSFHICRRGKNGKLGIDMMPRLNKMLSRSRNLAGTLRCLPFPLPLI